MGNEDVTVDSVAWAYDEYTFETAERLRIFGQHPDAGGVRQVFGFVEAVESETGDKLPDIVVSESEWEYDDYEIIDGVHLRIHGNHPKHGDVTQAFRLLRIEDNDTGEILREY